MKIFAVLQEYRWGAHFSGGGGRFHEGGAVFFGADFSRGGGQISTGGADFGRGDIPGGRADFLIPLG